ncbi:MAG: GGDEF domain-containing protein [Patescibacteria group bacterium]
MSTTGNQFETGKVGNLHILPVMRVLTEDPKDKRALLKIIEKARGRVKEVGPGIPEATKRDRAATLKAEIMEDLGIEGLESPLIEELIDTIIHLTGENAALREKNESLKQESRTDPLTGILNRRAFQEQMQRHVALDKRRDRDNPEAQRSHAYVMVAVDIDHFKKINDTHGHLAADEVLKQVAEIMRANVRSTDIAARLGGEEFVLVLLDTDIENARTVAEKVRKAVEEKTQSEGIKIPTTISLGIAGSDGTDLDTVLGRADRAMYGSKNNGRNQVTVAS